MDEDFKREGVRSEDLIWKGIGATEGQKAGPLDYASKRPS
jgi:hypothetical protein